MTQKNKEHLWLIAHDLNDLPPILMTLTEVSAKIKKVLDEMIGILDVLCEDEIIKLDQMMLMYAHFEKKISNLMLATTDKYKIKITLEYFHEKMMLVHDYSITEELYEVSHNIKLFLELPK